MFIEPETTGPPSVRRAMFFARGQLHRLHGPPDGRLSEKSHGQENRIE
jgi:hypothetical protein